MAKHCELCGEFISSLEHQQFSHLIKEKIADYGVVSVYDLDDSNKIQCEVCEKNFCLKCWQKRVYNGKSTGIYIEVFDKKFNTLASKTYVTAKYVCESCAQKKSNGRCHTCGKSYNQDDEHIFSGRHVGFHVKCNHCRALICLDCATFKDKKGKFQKKCPFCGKSKWLPAKSEILLEKYRNTKIHLNERQGFSCSGCGKEKTLLLTCKRYPKCDKIYCPDCLLKQESKNKSTCPSCKKAGFKPYVKELEILANKSILLPKLKSKDSDVFLTDSDRNLTTSSHNSAETIETDVVDGIESDHSPPSIDDAHGFEIEDGEEIDLEDFSSDKTIKLDSAVDFAIQRDEKQFELDRIQKITKLSTELDLELERNMDEEVDLLSQPLHLHEDLRRFVRVSNMLDDLKEFLEPANYTIQFSLQSGDFFYIRILNAKMIGNIGKYPKPSITSDPLTENQAKQLLHGIADLDYDVLHGDLELIEHFMNFHEMFDHFIHA